MEDEVFLSFLTKIGLAAPADEQVSLGPEVINRGSYMSAHVLLNLLSELGKRDKM